ncbi:SUN domain-containing protein 1-like isoform X2 [Liolophura sinensis]|uniref:SUN domain-containing protein 1-like isoform X2 n=1 Tax=Liolophura sinensis TaxID=3198878 RepID=UPI003158C2CB
MSRELSNESLCEDLSWEAKVGRPKTDYTYARTFIYRENPTLHEYISPNMSRRPIRGRVTMSPELKEFYRDVTEKEMDSLLGKSHTEEWVLRENRNNNAREAAYTTHSSHLKSTRHRHSSGQSTTSGISENAENGMLLRSGSRLHANNVDMVIENHDNHTAQNVDRKSMITMENAMRKRLFTTEQVQRNRNYNGWDSLNRSNSYQTRSGSYNQGYMTVRKTLVEEFEETDYSKASGDNSTSTKNTMAAGWPNGHVQNSRSDYSTSVSHMYGLDSDEYSDDELDGYEAKKGYRSENGANSTLTTVVTVVTTTIETITSVMRPVVTPVWYVVGRPLWYVLTSFWYCLAGGLSWLFSSSRSSTSIRNREEMSSFSRIRRAGCCLCLPLLLLLLLPLLFTGVCERFTHYEQSMFIPPPVVPLVKNTSVFNITMLTQEVTRIMNLKSEEQQQLGHDDVVGIVREILKEEVQAFRMSIEERNSYITQQINNIQASKDGKVDTLGLKLDEIMLKSEKLAAEIQSTKESIRLGSDQQDLIATRLGELEEELSALRTSFSNLDLNFQALSTNLKSCCGNSNVDLSEIRTFVNQILAQMMSGYGKNEGSEGGFVAWIHDNFINQEHFQSQLKSLGENLTLQMAVMAQQKQQPSSPNVVVSNGNMSETFLREMIDTALWKFHSDKTGIADYALESAGGSVVSVRCSKTYFRKTALFSVFGIPLWYISNSARTVIQPEMQPGECWPFEGKQGFVVIQLSTRIIPTSFSLEHIPKSISPSGNIDSAPSDFTVIGLHNEKDTVGVSLGNYTYSTEGSPLQYFPVQRENPGTFRFIELRVLDNHGNKDFTCLYRFRVHGDPVRG